MLALCRLSENTQLLTCALLHVSLLMMTNCFSLTSISFHTFFLVQTPIHFLPLILNFDKFILSDQFLKVHLISSLTRKKYILFIFHIIHLVTYRISLQRGKCLARYFKLYMNCRHMSTF